MSDPGGLPRTGAGLRIADEVKSAILGGEYTPGLRIRQEDLAARFGASRLPVREALRILEADGLVTLIPNTGAWVSRLGLAESVEIYQVRERIEPLLLRYSMPHLLETDLTALESLAHQMERDTTLEEFLRLDREFHLLSYRGASTTQLSELVHRLWNQTQHYRRAFTRLADTDTKRVTHDEHHMLTVALRDSDPDAAEQVLTGHIRRTRIQLVRHPEIFDGP